MNIKKQLRPFFFLLLVFTSCSGQVKTNPPIDNPRSYQDKLPKNQSELQASIDAGVDPYFVETQDTLSTHAPSCITRNLLQDKTGNFWLATWSGIVKYDGKIFTNYTLKENLIHFHVFSCYEDKKGNLWFGTVRGGVYRYDGRSFTLFTRKEGLPDNTVSCFAEDKEGNIWLGTDSGACRYDGRIFTRFTTKDGLSDNRITSMILDKTGKLWLGTNNGVCRYDGKSFAPFTDTDGSSFQKVASLFEDRNGTIWIGSGAKQADGKGLCRYDGQSVSDFVSPYFVMYLCQDKKGNLWLAHNKWPDNSNFTLYSFDGKSFTGIVEQGMDNPQIFGIMADRDGNIWFGTMKGPCCYNGKTFTCFSE